MACGTNCSAKIVTLNTKKPWNMEWFLEHSLTEKGWGNLGLFWTITDHALQGCIQKGQTCQSAALLVC